jgi:hypothetical protein
LPFLNRNGALDSPCPGERATEAGLSKFVVELQPRVAPGSVLIM